MSATKKDRAATAAQLPTKQFIYKVLPKAHKALLKYCETHKHIEGTPGCMHDSLHHWVGTRGSCCHERLRHGAGTSACRYYDTETSRGNKYNGIVILAIYITLRTGREEVERTLWSVSPLSWST